MKKAFLMNLAFLIFACPLALAEEYDLSFVNGAGTAWITVNGVNYDVYTGPYTMDVSVVGDNSGESTPMKLVCIDGAKWGEGDPYTLFDSNTNLYSVPDEAIYIALDMLSGSIKDTTQLTIAQMAVWQLVLGNDTTVYFTPGSSTALTQTAVDIFESKEEAKESALGAYSFFEATTTGDTGQSFIGLPVPEPSLPLLLGIGLLIVCPLALRRG